MVQKLFKASSAHNWFPFAVVGLAAVLAYANTLIADFTFDDNFAVITNGDVTNSAAPLKDLFRHDFWGQDISSSQSHKSYRPLTIIAFRLTHHAWGLITAVFPALPQQLPRPPPLHGTQAGEEGPQRPAGLHPFPFHALCVAMHAMVSMMVLALSQHCFAVLEDPCWIADGTSSSTSTTTPAGQHARLRSRQVWQQLCMWKQQPLLWTVPQTRKSCAQALLAGLMFALHPIHTEAVAGIVGCAELLCAALSIPALLCFFMAVDGRYAAAQQLQAVRQSAVKVNTPAPTVPSNLQAAAAPVQHQSAAEPTDEQQDPGLLDAADTLQHWLLVLAAVVLAVCAALSKEIGITVIGTMVLYDALWAPHMRVPVSDPASARAQQTFTAACRRQVLRMLLVAATAAAYIKLRQWVAVQQLVNIYRKVENPIPFAESASTRVLSTGYLHARYFWLLLVPLHLSADWSYNCIPLIESLSDVRNLATLGLYCYFMHTACSARPLSLLRQWWDAAKLICRSAAAASSAATHLQGQSNTMHSVKKGAGNGHVQASLGKAASPPLPSPTSPPPSPAKQQHRLISPTAHTTHGRWRFTVLVGLVIAPFFPASNVLFYVGTFIGERLLYFPSIGFCMLAADILGTLTCGSTSPAWQLQSSDGTAATQQHKPTAGQLAKPAVRPGLPGCEAADKQHGAGGAPSCTPVLSQQVTSDGDGSKQAGSRWAAVRSWCGVLLCALLLGAYAGRTLLRNQDWWDEGRLFLAALRVCPTSAKVQQNNGVLQRRYQNYSAAMEHFRLAQQIEPGYCEPTYWFGLTTFNMGDPLQGLSTMQDSLSCKYTAAEALQALNKIYLAMMEASRGTNRGPMLEWASVLSSPYVLRLADACATAEDAALGAALTGQGVGLVNKAMDVCFTGILNWEQGPAQADSLAALAKQRLVNLNTTLLSRCATLRRAVYRKMAGHDVRSMTVRRAIYKYIALVDRQHAACRTLAGGGLLSMDSQDAAASTAVPSTHQKLLHRVQAADPEDPWLQYEWGTTLLALNPKTNIQEAAIHLDVSAAIFTKASQDMQTGPVTGPQSKPRTRKKQLTALDGKTALTALSALQAALMPLKTFRDATVDSTDPDIASQRCQSFQRLCHLQLQVVMLLQQQEQGPGASSTPTIARAVQSAVLEARQCVMELAQAPLCKEQGLAFGSRYNVPQN